MKIIQNFTSGTHIKQLPIIDTLMGYNGLISFKKLGYKLKLYCKSTDILFLKKFGLFDFYDEIDTKFLNKGISPVNEENFGSTRKLACIENEFKVSSEPFIYMDTDIVLRKRLHGSSDLIVGTEEKWSDPGVYLPGEQLSLPPGTSLSPFLQHINDAYNCGVLGFKSENLFKKYLVQYYKFAKNNPCRIKKQGLSAYDKRTIGACNAEQRILKGVSLFYNGKVTLVDRRNTSGICPTGVHYFGFKHSGRLLKLIPNLATNYRMSLLDSLNRHTKSLLLWLPEHARQIFLRESPELAAYGNNNIRLTSYI